MSLIRVNDVFHLGYVVENLQQSMTDIAKVMAVTWAPLTYRKVPLANSTERSEPIGFTYSVEGPLHVELLSAVPGSAWTAASGEDIVGRQSAHHIGVWSDDLDRDRQRLESAGAWRLPGSPYYRLPGGLLIEPVDRRRKPAFDRWFAGEPFDG